MGGAGHLLGGYGQEASPRWAGPSVAGIVTIAVAIMFNTLLDVMYLVTQGTRWKVVKSEKV